MHPTDPSQPLGERLQGTNLYLVGMMGCGKSTVGPLLAKALGYRFLDADAVISQAAGCSIPEIFARDGEEGFRRLERQVLQQLSQWHSLVVATGGGIVTVPANWGELRQGVVIWLDVAEDELLRRLQADPGGRPLLAGDDPAGRLHELLRKTPTPLRASRSPRERPRRGRQRHQRTDLEGATWIAQGSRRTANHCTVSPGSISSAQAVSSSHSTCCGRPSTAAMSAGNCFSRCSCSANQ